MWFFGIYSRDLTQVHRKTWVRTFIRALVGTWRVTDNLGVLSWPHGEAMGWIESMGWDSIQGWIDSLQ